MAQIIKSESFGAATWIALCISLAAIYISDKLFGTISGIICLLISMYAVNKIKERFLCSNCGNRIESTTTLCPHCKETICDKEDDERAQINSTQSYCGNCDKYYEENICPECGKSSSPRTDQPANCEDDQHGVEWSN